MIINCFGKDALQNGRNSSLLRTVIDEYKWQL